MNETPRTVRNFWIDGEVDGRQSPVTGGPSSENGGFYLNIYMRDNGEVTLPVSIRGHYINGSLELEVLCEQRPPDVNTVGKRGRQSLVWKTKR